MNYRQSWFDYLLIPVVALIFGILIRLCYPANFPSANGNVIHHVIVVALALVAFFHWAVIVFLPLWIITQYSIQKIRK